MMGHADIYPNIRCIFRPSHEIYINMMCIFQSITKIIINIKPAWSPLNWTLIFVVVRITGWWWIMVKMIRKMKIIKQKCRWIDNMNRSSIWMWWYSMESIAIRPGHGVWGHDLISEVISWGWWRHASIIKEVINEIHDTMSTYMAVNSQAPERFEWNFRQEIFKQILIIDRGRIFYENALWCGHCASLMIRQHWFR